MTTEIQGRYWSYYADGQYPCTCFFCENRIEADEARWHSSRPSSIYACPKCFDGGIEAKLYPEGGQTVIEKASEVPVTAQTPPGVAEIAMAHEYAPTGREMAIARAHDENMESAKQTRNVLALLTSAIVELMKATRESSDVHAARTEILRKQLEEAK